MKKGIRSMAVTLTAAMLAGMVSGCGNSGQNTAGSAEQNTQQGTASAERVETLSGIDGKGQTIVIGIQQDRFIDNYDENYLTQKLEQDCNINIEFYLLPSESTEVKSKLSLMATNASDMPDILITNAALSNEMILDYGSKGILQPLNTYLADAAITPNFAAIPEEDKAAMLAAITMPDGNIYGLPKYEPATWDLTPYRYYINTAWLTKLNMEVPKTTDELYEVLKAFVNEDPNGNGKKDEIGVYGYATGGYGENIIWALMNSFEFYNGGKHNGGLALAEDGKTVIAPFVQDGWRQGLEYMHKLNQEGLLASSIFTDDNSQFKATLNAETPVVGLVCAGSTSNWADANYNPNFLELDIISPLTGPEGLAYTPYVDYVPGQDFFITSACEDPELASRIGDYFYDFDMSMTVRFGEKDVDWTMDEAICEGRTNAYVEMGVEDKIYLVYHIGEKKIWLENNSKFWHNLGPRYAPLLGIGGFGTASDGSAEFDLSLKTTMLNTYNYDNYYHRHPEKVLPLLKYTAEEGEALALPITNIRDLLATGTAEFVTGQRSLDDAGWEKYIAELNNLGLQEWLETAQAAYDRVEE